MTNSFNTVKGAGGIIAKAAAALLSDNLQFCKSITQVDPNEFEGSNGYKSGDTIYISKPPRFKAQSSFDITSTQQDIKEEKVPLTLDVISTVGIGSDSLEFATEIALKNYIKRVIEPAASTIAQDVEQKMLLKAYQATFNSVGTAGSNTFAPDDVLSAKEKQSKFLCPKDNKRFFLLDSTAGRKAVGERKGLSQASEEIAKQYKQGYITTADGFHWMENELLPVHTNGNDVAFEVRTTVSSEGASQIVVEGLTATTGTVKKGTVFTVAGVYAVHPITKQTYQFLQQFVVTADATADASGYATLGVSPAMYTATSGGLQNVSAFPADGATITPVGAASGLYTQNLAYHKNAFRMASVPLIMPTKAEFAEQRTVDGITVAIIRDWDQKKREMITRLDFLGGFCSDRPEWSCRVTS